MTCNITGDRDLQQVYGSLKDVSITSLGEILSIKTRVYYSESCGHIQTAELADIDQYYDTSYNILIENTDEDYLYKIVTGQKIYKADFESEIFLKKIKIPSKGLILDYGCAKSTTLKKIVALRKDLVPHLFDVSDKYVPFWGKFASKENWSTHHLKSEWANKFDVVTSFFALEHVSDPVDMLKKVHSVLKPGGIFYFIVPNVFANTADFVVVDHVNHFSEVSIKYLLAKANFQLTEIDATTHDSAYIVSCKKVETALPFSPDKTELNAIKDKVLEMAKYWSGISNKINEFENGFTGSELTAIYGSGFYGTYIASCLKNLNNVVYFFDNNPYRQGKEILGKKIIAPEKIDNRIQGMYVGLNPSIARNTIEGMTVFKDRKLKICYL